MFLDYYLRIKIKRSHMDILEITRKQDPLYPTFEQIYTASFPLFEQRTARTGLPISQLSSSGLSERQPLYRLYLILGF